MTSPKSPERIQLEKLSKLLLNIHKTLMDQQVQKHETAHGPISGPNHKLQLLLNDEEFQWLRALSQKIADIDGITFQKETIKPEQVAQSIQQILDLFFQDASADFSNKYREHLPTLPRLGELNNDLKEMLGFQ